MKICEISFQFQLVNEVRVAYKTHALSCLITNGHLQDKNKNSTPNSKIFSMCTRQSEESRDFGLASYTRSYANYAITSTSPSNEHRPY